MDQQRNDSVFAAAELPFQPKPYGGNAEDAENNETGAGNG